MHIDGVFDGDSEVVTEPPTPPSSLERADGLARPASTRRSWTRVPPLARAFPDAVHRMHGDGPARRVEALLSSPSKPRPPGPAERPLTHRLPPQTPAL